MNLINNKLDIIAKYFYNGNNSKFAKDFNVSDNTIRRYRKEKAPNFDFILALVNKLSINWEWLIHDRGDMINKNEDLKIQEPAPEYSLAQQLKMYREYVETLKENNLLKQQQINDLKNQVDNLERLLEKYKDRK
jgi:transcriptional regulator with XRE-family HTH domain